MDPHNQGPKILGNKTRNPAASQPRRSRVVKCHVCVLSQPLDNDRWLNLNPEQTIAREFFQISEFFFIPRCSAKKFCSNARHSCSRTPRVISQRWLKVGNCSRLITPPAAPAFGSGAPKTTRATRAWTIAPAHIGHGSLVTYSVQSFSRQ